MTEIEFLGGGPKNAVKVDSGWQADFKPAKRLALRRRDEKEG